MIENKINYVGKCLFLTKGKERVLVVGDLHLGFGEMLNKSGILVSRQMFQEVIDDFERIFAFIKKGINVKAETRGATGLKEGRSIKDKKEKAVVDKIILLGDVKHDFGGILKQEWSDVLKLFDYLSKKCSELVLIKGNHDNMLGAIAKKRGLKLCNYYCWKEFFFCHGHRDYEKIWKNKKIKTLIVGHGHPAIILREGIKQEKYKCFLAGKFRGKIMIVVPSFSEWYAGSDPREREVVLAWSVNFNGFEVFVVSDNLEVLSFGKLRGIK